MSNRLVKKTTRKAGRLFTNTIDSFLYIFTPNTLNSSNLKEDILRGIPIIGYLMVTMSIADCVFVAIPLKLQNPTWELATLGAISNHAWGILIGFGFILTTFSRDTLRKVRPVEIYIVNLFRTFILLLALIFILALPLVVVNTFRVNRLEGQQIQNQAASRTAIIAQVENNLNALTDIRQLLEIGQGLGLNLTYTPQSAASDLKKQIQEQLPGLKKRVVNESTESINSKRKYQWKSSARVFLQLFILSIANILLWFKTLRLKRLLE